MLQTLLDAVGPDGDAEGGAEGMVELLLGTLELHNASELPRPSLLRVARRALELTRRGDHGLRTAPEVWITPGKRGDGGSSGGGGAGNVAASAPAPGSMPSALSGMPPLPSVREVSASDVAMLRELKPALSEELCAHVLRRCAGDSATAAELLFSADEAALEAELEAEVRATHEREQAQRKAELKAVKQARKRAIDRNDAVRDFAADGDALQLSAPRLPYTQSRKDALKGSSGGTRYLDGQVVAHKGEKFITVSEKEEWDGGSRGRVKTKGKRGPGYR